MTLVQCYDCGNTIGQSAHVCPHCGSSDTPMNERIDQEDREYEKQRFENELLAHEGYMKSKFPLAHLEGVLLYLIFGTIIGGFLWLMVWFID